MYLPAKHASEIYPVCKYFYQEHIYDQVRCSDILYRIGISIFGDLNVYALGMVGVAALFALGPVVIYKLIPWERKEFKWEE